MESCRCRPATAIRGRAVAIFPHAEHRGVRVVVAVHAVHDEMIDRREAPDSPGPGGDSRGRVDLIDSPVVGGSDVPGARVAGRRRRAGECQSVGIGARVDLMGNRLASGPPGEGGGGVHARVLVGGLRLPSLGGDGEELHFAQAVRGSAVIAGRRDLHRLDCQAAEADRRAVSIGVRAGRCASS